MRVNQQPAYVLLNRPYSETSWILDVFTKNYGRLSLMAKGARRLKSKLKGVLLPFQPLLLSWSGKGEVPVLTAAEIDGELLELNGERLICGFYCNELLMYLLHRYDPHTRLYDVYHQAVRSLSVADHNSVLNSHTLLRDFECSLIKEIGYAVDFEYEAHGRSEIQDNVLYQYIHGQGFVRVDNPNHSKSILGQVIKSLHGENKKQTAEGKKVMREIMTQLLGHKKIYSRQLFFPKKQ